ncbi:hypothetical protein AB0I60_27400 [Actinosynnema sp. NPDC050436]|uniref:hypothetical protein n=1 Tax=Actinosynnema sp. NPDC050436 TaxID=3155659 RepID=UPI0033C77579
MPDLEDLAPRHPATEPAGGRPVMRHRLLDILDGCLSDARPAPVVVIRAPTGTGKTTLLTTWGTTARRPDRRHPGCAAGRVGDARRAARPPGTPALGDP